MIKKFSFMSFMLICMVTTFITFTTSCVQGDLYDLYEYDGWFFPRSKISKDIAADLYAALEYVSSSSIHSGDNECFAHALWCYGGGSLYNKRAIIGLNNNHLAVFQANDVVIENRGTFIYVEDQDGRHKYNVDKIDSAYQPD